MTKLARKPTHPIILKGYPDFLEEVKARIRKAQIKAALSVNYEVILLYWEIGHRLETEQKKQGWGSAVIPRLARDLHNELPEIKGFSERNLKRMIRFFREYPFLSEFVPQPVAQLTSFSEAPKVPRPVAQKGGENSELYRSLSEAVLRIPWGHNFLLLEKVKDPKIRLWYIHQTSENGWSRNVLRIMIDSSANERQGKAITNFDAKLPPVQSDLAKQILKDPYLFDFLTLEQPFHERELETGLIQHLEKFLLELGAGFAFVGRQVHLEVSEADFYIDLLFYHLKLRCFVVIELKTGSFKADYAGKMNFYLNVVDDLLRHPSDQPSIGLILCQEKNKILAEYALRGMTKAIGVSKYRLTRALPKKLRSSLPTIEEIEAELSEVKTKPQNKKGNDRRKSGKELKVS